MRLRETVVLILLLALGLSPRLAVASRFPTIPIGDFHVLVTFGLHLRDHGVFSNGYRWLWDNFNPGLPLVLCGLFHIFWGVDPNAVARLATVLACGLFPILPYLIWRGVLPLWVRLLAGAALALWPGQILFSGTVAQDNWVMIPAVALAALAVRALFSSEPPWLVTAGLLYAAAVAIRQEMLLMLVPLFLAAARMGFRTSWRRVAVTSLAAVLPLVALAAYRQACTGRFSLTTQHAGLTILGAYIPGAATYGWIQPFPFIASVRPDLLRNEGYRSEALSLAFREALRRPAFHATRIVSSVSTLAVTGEAESLHWSLEPNALPAAVRERGSALAALAGRPLHFELSAIQGLFLAAIIAGIRRRNIAILALTSAVLLKYGIHAVTNTEGRFFFVATALEILAIAVAAYEVRTMAVPGRLRLVVQALAVGAVFVLGLRLFAAPLAVFVKNHDVDQQRTYRFVLEPQHDHDAALSCTVSEGLLVSLGVSLESATLRTMQRDPAPGDKAAAVCELTGSGGSRPLLLQVLDPYAPGGFPDRLVQRVELDGTEVYCHDIAREPGSGWANIPLGQVGTGMKRRVVIEVKAIKPDPGPAWGEAARTTFQLSRPD